MTRFFISIALAGALLAQPAAAACFADYKAKRDNPLRLHYGVAEIRGACDKRNARAELARRLNGSGWTLLNVMGVFDEKGLGKRKKSAGPYFLRF